jgi:hypothetical protein
VGKTTVSGAVANRLGAVRLRTDVVRKELYDDPTYESAETDAVYDAVFERARETLEAGESVVLDATFRERARRERARSLAADVGVEHRLVHVTCDDAVVRERIAAREGDASDADVAVYERLRAEFEAFESPPTVVDNSGDRKALRRQLSAEF